MIKMNFYKIEFTINEKNQYIYPKDVKSVEWKQIVYHHKDPVMIGSTDKEIKADEKRIKRLEPEEAKKLMESLIKNYPKVEEQDYNIKQ